MYKNNRLFLFAGYDANGIIDDSLILYIKELAKFGDISLCMDSDCDETQIQKIKPFVLHAVAKRHGEYDFGSYKRAYIWARDNLSLSSYDFIYILNDSVYGPLYDLGMALQKMESSGTDAFGLVKNTKSDHPHIQSWFIGMRKSVFLSDWFDNFLSNVKKLESKGAITHTYEHGFTKHVLSHGGKIMCLYSAHNRDIYNKIKYYFRKKMPFMKKVAFIRHNGQYGPQISYVLKRIPQNMRDAILQNAYRVYGKNLIDTYLSLNRISAFFNGLKYGIKKSITGKL